MAVIFISPKKRQRVFFTIITAIFILFVVAVYFAVFLAKPVAVVQISSANLSKANIDMSVFDSKQFQALQPFLELDVQASKAGRDNPFVPYYQVTPTLAPAPIQTKK